MKISGLITQALPEESGVSKNGKAWRKRAFVMTYDNSNPQFPKSVVFDVFGEKIDQLAIVQGQEYELEIDFEARPWQNKVYLQASCWKATALNPQPQQAPPPAPAPAPQGDSDLPF